jgi:hypothetical protein
MAVALALGFLGRQNAAVTGSPWTMPYQAYQQEYGSTPLFLFWEPGPLPEYRHKEMRDYALEWGQERHNTFRRPGTFVQVSLLKLAILGLFFLGPGLLVVVVSFRLPKHPWTTLALLGVVSVVGISMLTKATYTHYVAPITGLLYVLIGRGLLLLHRRARTRRKINLALVATLLLLPWIPFRVGWKMLVNPSPFGRQRVELEAQLEAAPGKDLVFVRYTEEHTYLKEWVYNRADIDRAEVVWARDLATTRNRTLIDYYPDRVVWLLTVGDSAELAAYPDSDP